MSTTTDSLDPGYEQDDQVPALSGLDFDSANDDDLTLANLDLEEPIDDERAVCDEEAQALTLRWRPQAMGTRPTDFLVRDLYRNNLRLLQRADGEQRKWAEAPEWMGCDVDRWQPHLTTVRTVMYLHYCQLLRVKRYADSAANPDISEMRAHWINRKLKRIVDCRPQGFLVDVDDDLDTFGWPSCHYTHVCPYCYARQVVNLFRWCATEPSLDPRRKCLIMGLMPLPGLDDNAALPLEDLRHSRARRRSARSLRNAAQ